ncbi:hypothetical protein C8Q78DRAFT_178828 [Trametes maxima]|nr:hypothetical protein C8Q78DRAFT_178828 [Trametes maxima]
MSSIAYVRWEVFVSVVGVLAAIPLGVQLAIMQLPSRKLEGLFGLLERTHTQLKDSIEEGVLREHHIHGFQYNLTVLQSRANEVCSQVNAARGFSEELRNLAKGLTNIISRIHKDAHDLHADICTTSNREREERARVEGRRNSNADGGGGGLSNSHGILQLTARAFLLIIGILGSLVSIVRSSVPLVARIPLQTAVPNPLRQDSAHMQDRLSDTPNYATAPLAAPSTTVFSGQLHGTPSEGPTIPSEGPSCELPSVPSLSPSRYKRKNQSSPYSRIRAMARFLRWCRRKRAIGSSHSDALSVSWIELASIEPLPTDNDGDEWEDVSTQAVQVVV